MVYHIPTMLKKYGNLKQFSGQGTIQYTLILTLCVRFTFDYTINILQVLKKIMTPSTTTSLATNTMHLEKSSEVSVDRRHYSRGVWDHPTCVRKRRSYTKQVEDY